METAEFRSAVSQLSTLAERDLAALLASLEGRSSDEIRDALLDLMPEVASPYAVAASEVAAAYYEQVRASAVGGSFYATADGAVNQERLDALVRWGVKPLYGQSEATVLSLIGGGLQRVVATAARETIDRNAREDVSRRNVAATSWSRVARPDACEFCTMLAGRGPVYRSASAAGAVIGRGVDPSAAFNADGSRKRGGIGGGVSARGARALSAKYHDNCHCLAEPTFYRLVENYTSPSGVYLPSALMPIK